MSERRRNLTPAPHSGTFDCLRPSPAGAERGCGGLGGGVDCVGALLADGRGDGLRGGRGRADGAEAASLHWFSWLVCSFLFRLILLRFNVS